MPPEMHAVAWHHRARLGSEGESWGWARVCVVSLRERMQPLKLLTVGWEAPSPKCQRGTGVWRVAG